MALRVIHSDQAPKAIGPYSQAIAAPCGELLFLSGQIPLDPATGVMVAGDVGAQTERVMANLAAVLAAAGLTFRDVAKTTIFLADLADYGVVNEIYARWLDGHAPARAAVQVAGLPRGSRVEIEMVAVRSAG